MQALTTLHRVPAFRSTDHRSSAVVAAKVLVVAGVASYNWWVVVPFVPGLMPSVNGFFSDLEATGRPHAGLMSGADLAAGLLMTTALLLRGSRSRQGARAEWKWMVGFAVAGAVGGRYTYACAEGLSATCRSLEWHLQLPAHHYVHVFSGVAEFVTLTVAVVLAMRRTRNDGTWEARIYAGLVKVMMVGYPFLGLAYLTDRLGTLAEPVFFVAFSVMVLTEVFEPLRPGPATTTWADRVARRGGDAPAAVVTASSAAGRAVVPTGATRVADGPSATPAG